MHSPKIGPREIVYQDKYQSIYRVTADFGDFEKEYFVRDAGQRVGLLVIKENSVLLVRQYRFLIDGLSWEVPGGGVDEGESLEAAAVRECQEETGLLCRDLKPLVNFYPGLDTANNPTHMFYTDQFLESPAEQPDLHEVAERVWVTLPRCIDMIFSQEIVDSLSIVALLAYQTQLDRRCR